MGLKPEASGRCLILAVFGRLECRISGDSPKSPERIEVQRLRISKLVILSVALSMVCLGTSEAATKKSTHKTTTGTHKSSGKATKKKSARARGQALPDSGRTREIQTALIREHYMSGAPSGSWDSQTRDALTRYQKDHGWQTKVVPDSRALIKLGLGPSREGLLNPDTAALSPHEMGAEKPQPGGSGN